MKIKIDIDCGNDAFYPEAKQEVIRLLSDLVIKIASSDLKDVCLSDINGNHVGDLKIIEGDLYSKKWDDD